MLVYSREQCYRAASEFPFKFRCLTYIQVHERLMKSPLLPVLGINRLFEILNLGTINNPKAGVLSGLKV